MWQLYLGDANHSREGSLVELDRVRASYEGPLLLD
jgi:hypothetical protein